ncbi:MAG: phospho-sugar mutase [Ruminococcaceae bacterium]|nr:phospho-sugar mutase [Oscillospiraceae bacterium]
MTDYLSNYKKWLNSDILTESERTELLGLDENEIKERFSCYLSFGTAGLRGKMKTGMNAMNVHTVALVTQGLANLLVSEGNAERGVTIAYDSRNNSEIFAKTSASVLAANGVKVYIFDSLRPTPELSFALRRLGCAAGINVTASHNPKEYNGYKAYGEDGAQLSPEAAAIVADEMAKTDVFADIKRVDFDTAVAEGKITVIGDEMDEAYLAAVTAEAVYPEVIKSVADDLKIVYSPLHGAGYKLVPNVLSRMGFKHIYMVQEQAEPDGDFPTVEKPNPEYREAFMLGIELANKVGSDLIVATDPDADRVGVFARAKNGEFVGITGNQMGALLLDYILTAYEETNTMPPEPYAVKSIVSTELATKVCQAHGIELFNVLTGFKFIGEVIKNHEKLGRGSFVLGFEESYGYLKGTYARDKDAVVASMIICEMTAFYKSKNMTLMDALYELYDRLGFSYEVNDEIYAEGLDGAKKIAAIMSALRTNAPSEIGGVAVADIGDYMSGYFTDVKTGEKRSTNLAKSNALYFKLENGDVIVVRPSGTEPKIKFYYLVTSANNIENAKSVFANYKATIDSLQA